MLDDLVRSAYKDEKSIVYCYSAVTARRIMAYVKANPITSVEEEDPVAVPRMALVTSDTLANDGRKGTIKAMENAQVAIVTSGLDIGSSFPLPDMFDRAFAFIEYKDRTRHVDDMVQLCARLRATSMRHLSYTVRNGTAKPCSNVEKNRFLMPRKDTLDSVPRLLAVAYYDRKDLHRAHYTFLKLAREATKDALLKGFSHSAECSLDYVQPAYELNIEPPEEGVNARMRKARIMLKNVDAHLPDSLVHLSNKAPCKLVRGDNEADEFEDVDLPPKSELVNVRYHPTGATRSSTTARGVWTGMKTTM